MDNSTRKDLQATINSLDVGVVVVDDQLNVELINDAFHTIWKTTDDDFKIGDPFRQLVDVNRYNGIYDVEDDEWEDYVASRAEEIKIGNVAPREFQRADGVHMIYSVTNLSDDRRLISYIDNTAQKEREFELQAEQAKAQEAQDRLFDAISVLDDGFVIFDQEDRLVVCNEVFRKQFGEGAKFVVEGETYENMTRKIAGSGIIPGIEGKEEEFVQNLIEKRKSEEGYSTTFQRHDGIWIRQRDKRTPSGDLVGVRTNITELKARELELEQTSTILTETTDAMAQGIIVFKERKIVFFNSNAAEMTGLGDDILHHGQTIDDFLRLQLEGNHFGDSEVAQKFYDDHLAALDAGKPYQLERKTNSGKTLRVDGVPGADGSLTLTFTDITEISNHAQKLEKAMEIAESAERAKSEFLANMSHEIRTPMNGVMGMAELLVTTELDAKQKMFTDVIVKSGASLLTIINDILDFSKIDAGQMELDPAPFNLAEAIEDVATLVSAKVAEKDLELIVRVDPGLPKVMVGDVGRIRQIITNLLGNAVKFTERGHVYVNVDGQVDTSKPTGMADLKFSVEDTGIGIPQEKCDQIFQKFSQVDTSATRKHEGTGLGLSIASSLVELMGGEIGIESTVGQGSTFWFTATLPVHGQESKAKAIPGDLSGSRILIIDDNSVNRSILTEQMTAWQFDSTAARSGAEGLQVMQMAADNNIDIDLVILDYQMPEMSGAEVLGAMRSNELLKNIPVVMLTSVDSSQANNELNRLGVSANLTKPTRSSLLLETILQVIADHRVDHPHTRTAIAAEPTSNKPLYNEPDLTSEPVKQEAPQAKKFEAESLDVLVAEDNEVNQIVFSQILEEAGLNFKIVENGRLALANYKVQQPKLILMDVSMPEMNGKEATGAIRALEQENTMPHVPIIGVTAHALKGDMESCLDAGMDDYLSKPVSPNKLMEKINHWMAQNTAADVA